MPAEKICRTVRQYSVGAIPEQEMAKLLEIAEDYKSVKNYVYARYGGVRSLSKLYPGYTIQNEMTQCGLRAELNLPSVYFYLAIFDALGDIKSHWTWIKAKLLERIGENERFAPKEKHYLRFLIKVNDAFEAVLNRKEMHLPTEMRQAYEEIASSVDRQKLNRYLCKQVRKYHTIQHTDKAEGFSVSGKAYRYADHGIYITTKEKRRRIFLPLTDNNRYCCQIYLKLEPEKSSVEIHVPIDVTVKRHRDYTNYIGVAFGMHNMFTTQEGHHYGEELGRYHTEYVDWMRKQVKSYNLNKDSNPGRKKYEAQKRRYTEQLHSYINRELNRFLQTEKPRTIYIAKLPRPRAGGENRKINHSITMWQRGYIRQRLFQKCRENSVELVEVFGKGISTECSRCGAGIFSEKKDSRVKDLYVCSICGYTEEKKKNTARNIWKRGMAGCGESPAL